MLDENQLSMHYAIVFEKSTRTFDKTPVRVDPAERVREEGYKDIRIKTFVGTSVPLSALIGE